MNSIKDFLHFLKSKKATPDELNEINDYFETIVNSRIVDIENHNSGKLFKYKYDDGIFNIEKSVYKNLNGKEEIKESITLTESQVIVYNGKMALNPQIWISHLKEVYEIALEEEKKPRIYK